MWILANSVSQGNGPFYLGYQMYRHSVLLKHSLTILLMSIGLSYILYVRKTNLDAREKL